MVERPNTPPEAFPGAFFEYDEGSPTGTMILHYHGHVSAQDLELFDLLPNQAVITHTTGIEDEPITRVEFIAPNPDYMDENNSPLPETLE